MLAFARRLAFEGEAAPGHALWRGPEADRSPWSSMLAVLFGDGLQSEPRVFSAAWHEADPPFDRSALEALILADDPAASRMNCIVDSVARPLACASATERVDIAARLYSEGHSLLLTGVERHSPPLARLCRSVDLALLRCGIIPASGTSANAYLGPPDGAGLPLHYDDHGVIVLQLAGTKRWTVHPAMDPLPTARCMEAISPDRVAPPCIGVVLAAGDALYVPRGHPHVARSGGEGSLHVTLALRTVPRDAVPGDGVAEALRPLTPLAGDRFAAIDAAGRIGPATPIAHADDVMLVPRTDGDVASLFYPGGVLRLDRAMASVFAFVADHRRFTPAQLPEVAAEYDRLEFVRSLIRRGLLIPAAHA